MSREFDRRLRRLEGARAENRPVILPFPPRSDGRPWTWEEIEAKRSWHMTPEAWAEIFCSELSHEEIEAKITAELHRHIERAKRLQR